MFSFENGVLRIEGGGEKVARLLYEMLFVANIVVIFAFVTVKYVATVVGFAMFAASLLILFSKRESKIVFPYITMWYGIFTAYAVASLLWVDFNVDLDRFLRMFMILLISTSVAIYVDTHEHLERLLSLFLFSVLIIVVLELSSVPVSEWFESAMGYHFSYSNPNEIAFWVFCAEVIAFYKAYAREERWNYLLAAVFLFYIVLSASRKGLIGALFGPVMIIGFTKGKKFYFLKLFLILLLAAGVFYIVMTNEDAYNSIGRRFDSLFRYYEDGSRKSDGSAYMRDYFKEVGRQLFERSPIIGNGLDSFKMLGDEFGIISYAHNNYWQILSELGLIGFIIYYSFYVYLIVKLAVNILKYRSKTAALFLTMMLLLIVMETALVSLHSKYVQLIIALTFPSVYVDEDDGRRFKYLEQ